jgi:hypothetical protein
MREWTLYNDLKRQDPKEQYWIQYKNLDPIDITINPNQQIQQMKKEITSCKDLGFTNTPTSLIKLFKEDHTILKPQDLISSILKPQETIFVEVMDK